MNEWKTDRAPAVFISYRRDDVGWLARHLATQLESMFGEGAVFLDVTSVGAAESVSGRIRERLALVDAVLVLVGPAWAGPLGSPSRIEADDDWVRIEVAEALASESTTIPVLVGDAGMPRPDELPSDVRGLCDLGAIRMRLETFEDDLARLLRALWAAWGRSVDVVVLADGHHEVLVDDFLAALADFSITKAAHISRLASGIATIDFTDEQHRPVLVALVPDAPEWDDFNERLQRLRRTIRFGALVVLVGGATGAFVWDEAQGLFSGPGSDHLDPALVGTGPAPQIHDVSEAVVEGRLVPGHPSVESAIRALAEVAPALKVAGTTGPRPQPWWSRRIGSSPGGTRWAVVAAAALAVAAAIVVLLVVASTDEPRSVVVNSEDELAAPVSPEPDGATGDRAASGSSRSAQNADAIVGRWVGPTYDTELNPDYDPDVHLIGGTESRMTWPRDWFDIDAVGDGYVGERAIAFECGDGLELVSAEDPVVATQLEEQTGAAMLAVYTGELISSCFSGAATDTFRVAVTVGVSSAVELWICGDPYTYLVELGTDCSRTSRWPDV